MMTEKTNKNVMQPDYFKDDCALVKEEQAYTLEQLDLYNWGSFGGRHSVNIDPRGTAIIGGTGSGKTTLVDALMTLLCAYPKYNLASTGGHDSDRNMMSYLRGVSGAGSDDNDNAHIARPEKVSTGISATFKCNQKIITIASILWVDSSSTAVSDRKDIWIVCERNDQSLDDWLNLRHSEGARAVKQLGKTIEKLHVYDTKKAYLAHVKRFFEVGDNAFSLLNRAVGLKQINNIDKIFQELVLDDHSGFEQAKIVAQGFDDLTAIHTELITARRQQKTLLPIEKNFNKHKKIQEKFVLNTQLLGLIDVWFANGRKRLLLEKKEFLEDVNSKLNLQIEDLGFQKISLKRKSDTQMELYLNLGGSSIEQLKITIESQAKHLAQCQQNASDYQQIISKVLKVNTGLTKERFLENQALISNKQSTLEKELAIEKTEQEVLAGQKHNLKASLNELEEEMFQIKSRPDSNIPVQYQNFRQQLIQELDISEDDIAFVAELLEVKSQDKSWRGAIERALGGHRLRLLVSPEHITQTLKWVNNRNNKLHVRLVEAVISKQSNFLSDGFTRKLNFKAHKLREPLKLFLSKIDRHCVSSVKELENTPYAMTQQGTMSGKSGMFEKQDKSSLNSGWLTGFDNKDRLASLSLQISNIREKLSPVEKRLGEKDKYLDMLRQNLQLLDSVSKTNFSSIDVESSQEELRNSELKLEALTDSKSKVGQAKKLYDALEKQYKDVENKIIEITRENSRAETEAEGIQKQLDFINQKKLHELNETEQNLAQEYFANLDSVTLEQVEVLYNQSKKSISEQREKIINKRTELEKTLVREMSKALKEDSGDLVNVGTEMLDIQDYLDRLAILTQEALPEKLNRFLEYLNQSSDQAVNQLLTDLNNEVSKIEMRIDSLNITLQKVDFQPNRYLRLIPKKIVHERLRTLNNAQKNLRTAEINSDQDQGEKHYLALKYVVDIVREAADNKNIKGSKALLDPRHRLKFYVSVVERGTDKIIETRTGSQGGSGGEKEIIANYILTASLSYALSPDSDRQPLFGTIVLDEAFSKSSRAVANRIINAIQQFGLHPLFVTPNKEMRLLRENTRNAVLVHRSGLQSTLTSISWEELMQKREKLK